MIGTYLQILARRSPLPVAKSFPVGLGATEMTANRQRWSSNRKRHIACVDKLKRNAMQQIHC